MTTKTRIIEGLSLALEASFVVAVFTLLAAWVSIAASQAYLWKRPFPPSQVELELANCQRCWLEYPMLGTAMFSVLLRVIWLARGRGYAIPRAIGRTVFDHTISAFLALVLVAQGSLTPAIQALTRQVNQQCEILPWPVFLRPVDLSGPIDYEECVMIVTNPSASTGGCRRPAMARMASSGTWRARRALRRRHSSMGTSKKIASHWQPLCSAILMNGRRCLAVRLVASM